MAIQAGQLRDLVTLQEKASGAWRNKYVGMPAYIRPLAGREKWQAEMVAAQIDTRIVIRWIEGINASNRILCGSQVFLIKSAIDPTRLQHELVLDCQEVFNA